MNRRENKVRDEWRIKYERENLLFAKNRNDSIMLERLVKKYDLT